MPGFQGERRAGHITQLGFDSLAVSASDGSAVPAGKPAGIAPFGKLEVYRSAPQSRSKAKKHAIVPHGIQQATLDELFDTIAISGDADIARGTTTREPRRGNKHNGRIKQLDFDSLAELPPEDGGAVPEGKPAGSGTGNNGAAGRRPDAEVDGSEEDGLPGSLGDSTRPV